jgi:hypothetical protein
VQAHLVVQEVEVLLAHQVLLVLLALLDQQEAVDLQELLAVLVLVAHQVHLELEL